MIPRLYLAAIGFVYAALAIWCSVAPTATSAKVGFTLNGDSGRSEFLTVYGGLEFGMALIFLMPLPRPDAERFALLSCILIHASLVAFRSVSLLIHRDFGSTTANLAIGEWVILLCSIAIWVAFPPTTVSQ